MSWRFDVETIHVKVSVSKYCTKKVQKQKQIHLKKERISGKGKERKAVGSAGSQTSQTFHELVSLLFWHTLLVFSSLCNPCFWNGMKS
jgi:hypothetical protein